MFPRGWLREPVSSLKRAGAVLLTRCDQVTSIERRRINERVSRLNCRAIVVETSHRPVGLVNARRATAPLDRLREKPVIAFCGLGNPVAFRRTLLDLGAQLGEFRSYPDHHRYSRADIEDLRVWAGKQPTNTLVVTTQKDLVKLGSKELGERELWAVRIRLSVQKGQNELDEVLARILDRQGMTQVCGDCG
jgi:tetraacyldisaccharide 4'-kinase